MPLRADHGLQTNSPNLRAQHLTGGRGFFFSHVRGTRCFRNVRRLAVPLCCWASRPESSAAGSLLCEAAADADTSRPAHSAPAVRNARCFSALLCLPIDRKISGTMGVLGGLGGEPKKAPGPLDNTDKQIFLHAISKRGVQLSKGFFKGKKYFCCYSLFSDRPASLTMLHIRTVRCLHVFFWTLQDLPFTPLQVLIPEGWSMCWSSIFSHHERGIPELSAEPLLILPNWFSVC